MPDGLTAVITGPADFNAPAQAQSSTSATVQLPAGMPPGAYTVTLNNPYWLQPVTASFELATSLTLAVSASPTSVPVDGATPYTVTATLTDAAGAPLSGETVDFATTLGTLGAASATTDAQGQAKIQLRCAMTGYAIVTA